MHKKKSANQMNKVLALYSLLQTSLPVLKAIMELCATLNSRFLLSASLAGFFYKQEGPDIACEN